MSRMFGTDGVRGIANGTLSCELAMQIGIAGAYVLSDSVKHPTIIIGTDTRKSKDMLKCALISGICAAGGNVLDAGVIPTPALPFLTPAPWKPQGCFKNVNQTPSSLCSKPISE